MNNAEWFIKNGIQATKEHMKEPAEILMAGGKGMEDEGTNRL